MWRTLSKFSTVSFFIPQKSILKFPLQKFISCIHVISIYTLLYHFTKRHSFYLYTREWGKEVMKLIEVTFFEIGILSAHFWMGIYVCNKTSIFVAILNLLLVWNSNLCLYSEWGLFDVTEACSGFFEVRVWI